MLVEKKTAAWFKVTLSSPIWRSPFQPLKGSRFHHLKKVPKNCKFNRFQWTVVITLLKFNSSPLKSYWDPIGKDRLPTIHCQLLCLRGGYLLGIVGSQYKDPYEQTSMMKCHEGFDAVGKRLPCEFEDSGVLKRSSLRIGKYHHLVGSIWASFT